MPIHVLNAYLNTSKEIDILNATHDVKRALRESNIQNGLITVYVPGTTAGVVILENDPAVHEDLKKLVTSFVPDSGGTRPKRKSGSGRAESHLRAAFLSSSVSIPVKDGRLLMGAWQEVIVIDFDDKVGRCEVTIHVMGEEPEKKK